MAKRQYSRRPIFYTEWKPFTDLPDTAQNLYTWLITMPNITQAGVVPIQLRRWASLSGNGTVDRVCADLAVLEERGFIVIDKEREDLLVVPFIADDKVGNKSAEHGAIEECSRTSSPLFFATLADQLAQIRDKLHPDNQEYAERVIDWLDRRSPDGLPTGYRRSTVDSSSSSSSSGSCSAVTENNENEADDESDDDPFAVQTATVPPIIDAEIEAPPDDSNGPPHRTTGLRSHGRLSSRCWKVPFDQQREVDQAGAKLRQLYPDQFEEAAR